MSIPKIIHYCWFGGAPFSTQMEKCIASWKQFCPDYEIIQWNETNFDLSDCPFAQNALKNKLYAFVSDYVRNVVVYKYGGIYLDTDVELIKSLDPLLELKAYAGTEDPWTVANGLGFGSEKNNPIIAEFIDVYLKLNYYNEDGTVNTPVSPAVITSILVKHGFVLYKNEIQQIGWFTIFPIDYFCPYDIRIEKMNITKNTYSIHYYSASWYTQEQNEMRKKLTRKRKLERLIGKKMYGRLLTLKFLLFEGGIIKIIKNKIKK